MGEDKNSNKAPAGFNRRRFLITGALAGGAGAAVPMAHLREGGLGAPPAVQGVVPWREGTADAPPQEAAGAGYRFFSAAEQAFIEPAIERLIPPDESGPSAMQAGVNVFLDRQLAGPFGRGDHYFLGGPWPKGVPQQGYQSRMAPAQLYRTAIPAIETYVREQHPDKSFKTLAAQDQDAVLKALESGDAKLKDVESKAFFTLFLQNVIEGYFSDPIYGGNKDMAAWKMIGFPGAHYNYLDWVARHGERVPFAPVGIKGRPGWSDT